MLHFKPGADRSKLGFKDAVLSSFTFLGEYGFRPVRAEPTFVRYETTRPSPGRSLFLNVYHGRGSYELGVEIGLCDQDQAALTLPLIVEWATREQREGSGQQITFQVSTRDGVKRFVPKLAVLVQKYAKPFLKGDINAYQSAGEYVRRGSVLYEKGMLLRSVREQAEVAWHDKDYAQVVNVYEPFKEDLSQSESMRLEYAKKRVRRFAKVPGKH